MIGLRRGAPMADDWLVLSDRAVGAGDTPSDLIESGLFVVEFALPLDGPVVLLDFHATEGWDRTFTLFHDPAAGLVLIHRQGKAVARHALPLALPQRVGTGRLSLRFDAPARHWSMRFDLLGAEETPPLTAHGQNPLPLRPADLHALSLPPFRRARHGAVLWFGLTRKVSLPARAPWIGQRTPIDTPRGPVPAGCLRPGDMICTADGGLLPLCRITRMTLPACGSFAPVILRAPFFGTSHDLLVSSDQRVALSGPEVEYLFNEDEVLVEAGAMVDGRAALAEQRRAVTTSLMLEFDHPALLVADGCVLLAARPKDALPRRMLQPYEVLTLMALMGRAGHRRVA
jgi:Hint domain